MRIYLTPVDVLSGVPQHTDDLSTVPGILHCIRILLEGAVPKQSPVLLSQHADPMPALLDR